MDDFYSFYKNERINKGKEIFRVSNPMAVPKILKIVVNVGVGEAVTNRGVLDKVSEQIALITGQKPIITKARKSVSAFKIRKGFPIGVKVTLRGRRMLDFLQKIIKMILPRLRDFRGVSLDSVDKRGNLNLGFTEQTIFPEIDYDKIDKIRGLQVTIVSNAKSKEKGIKLYELLGIPFDYGKKIR